MSSQFTQQVRQPVVPQSAMIHHPQPTMRPSVPGNMPSMPSMGGLNGGGNASTTTCAAAPMTGGSSSDNDSSSILDKFLETSTTTKLIIIGSIVALVAVGYFAYKKYEQYKREQMENHITNGLMQCMEFTPSPDMVAQMQRHGYVVDAQQQNQSSVPMTCEGDKCYPTPVEPQLATPTPDESKESAQEQEQTSA